MTINRHFADALVKLLREDDVIWVHDYHLIPLGSLLRQAGVKAPSGVFPIGVDVEGIAHQLDRTLARIIRFAFGGLIHTPRRSAQIRGYLPA